jgi:uncharacterized protein YaiI (UPF0178 family)
VIGIEKRSSAIVVDADACPVKDEIIRTANEFNTPVMLVASINHHMKPSPGVEIIQVDSFDQAVDLYIANHIGKGDILITQDYGLATIGLAKQAYVISPRGMEYRNETISFLLDTRHHESKRRRAGQKTKGPKAYTTEDRQHFQSTLQKILQASRSLNSIGE